MGLDAREGRAAGPSQLKRVGRVLAVVLVFVLLGPPVGGVVFMLTVGLLGLARDGDVAGLTWIALFAVIYAVPLSYLAGAVPAAVAGLLVGIRQAYFGPASLLYAAGAGLLVGFGLLFLSGQPLAATSDAPVVVMLAMCLVPTLVCWLIVRGWHFVHVLARQGA